MGSAFKSWEYDDGGIDQNGLSLSAGHTRILLAKDRSDPVGTNTYFNDNLAHLCNPGLQVETFRPNSGTHEVTDAMKDAVLQRILK
jgi:hypothetical protein